MTEPFRRTGRWALAALLLLALSLRLYHVDRYGIFFDEKSTLLISQGVCLEGANQKDVFTTAYHGPATGPTAGPATGLTGDARRLRTFTPAEFWAPKTLRDFIEANIRGDIGNSPTYYAVLWAWTQVFGLSDFAIRLPSVLFSTLIVLLLWAFVRRHIRLATPGQTQTLALLAAGLGAIEPFFIAHSQVARNYSLTFLLTLAATYGFLSILERTRQGASPTYLIAGYGGLFVLSVLSHYLAVTVFLCHALYALLVLRRAGVWVQLALAGAAGLGLISLWFIYGGGAYTFRTLAYQAELYRNLALTNPYHNPYGLILPATWPNILLRSAPIFSDLFIFANGLGSNLLGLRNAAVAVGLGALATGLLHGYRADLTPPVWVKAGFAGLLLLGLPLYSTVPGRFLVLSALLPLLYLMGLGIRALPSQATAYRAGLLVGLSLLPTFFLILMAWRGGHTFGLTQRYSGFSFPYLMILIGLGFMQLPRLRPWFSVPLGAVLAVQAFFVAQLLLDIYGGRAGKYTQFGVPRERNPYWAAAQTLQRQYAPGDTIVYPNKDKAASANKMDASFIPVSILDAQLVNIYLPPTATYPQRVDPDEHDRVFLLKKATGQRQLIANLAGKRY